MLSHSAAVGTMIPQLGTFTLMITAECNLGCTYCYVPKRHAEALSEHSIQRAVEFLSQHARDPVTVALFGGEPLLATETVEQVLIEFRRGLAPNRVRFNIPTNLMHPIQTLVRWAQELDVELWLSVDPDGTSSERQFPNGADASSDIKQRLRTLLSQCRPERLVVRSTVTPNNVTGLRHLLGEVVGLGVERCAVVPALDMNWDDDSIMAWGEQHRRIGLWLRGLRGAGRRLPWISSVSGVVERLTENAPRPSCGAGDTRCAMDHDGTLHACHRFLCMDGRERFALGTLENPKLEVCKQFRNLETSLMPEQGSCSECSAMLGCIHFCPAVGVALLGELDRVPEVACRLMQEQVRAISEGLNLQPERRSVTYRGALASVLLGAAAVAACGGRMEDSNSGGTAGQAEGTGGANAEGGRATGGAKTIGGEAGDSAGGSTGTGGASTGGTYWDFGCIG